LIQEVHKERLWMAAGHLGHDQNNLIKSANVYFDEIFKRESLFNELNKYKHSLQEEVNDALNQIKQYELDVDKDKVKLIEHQEDFNKLTEKGDS